MFVSLFNGDIVIAVSLCIATNFPVASDNLHIVDRYVPSEETEKVPVVPSLSGLTDEDILLWESGEPFLRKSNPHRDS